MPKIWFYFCVAGNEVLMGQDMMFYGHSDEEISIEISANQVHIFFVSDLHFENAAGFTIHYNTVIGNLINCLIVSKNLKE